MYGSRAAGLLRVRWGLCDKDAESEIKCESESWLSPVPCIGGSSDWDVPGCGSSEACSVGSMSSTTGCGGVDEQGTSRSMWRVCVFLHIVCLSFTTKGVRKFSIFQGPVQSCWSFLISGVLEAWASKSKQAVQHGTSSCMIARHNTFSLRVPRTK